MHASKLNGNADAAAALLSLLANGKRLAIIEQLLDNEMSVGAIAEKVSLSQSALSQHLAKLRSLNLVETRRDRQMIYYSCKSQAARRVIETLEELFAEEAPKRVMRRAANG
ncbi:metalloregulator ArsR/SmtB family transcription factor [Mesorhizobium sp. BAC0120]|jgi:DNA-binding transcriptional ArsR family regulator|uniref:ArsR/SmtB family transcription factor n=1 Tax=Mesorhizobium sp. BAC0120 TaxID=3090670 RepID=UPI00298D159C|nr:metalloregulator ArsR/SmtB family transcription factor [Mesorhizobium sp. BAC0120]MDW6022227.1 metalloregulator ArsR/SmtB family transcription factor [Mesorhizobium sp. BAC0120]